MERVVVLSTESRLSLDAWRSCGSVADGESSSPGDIESGVSTLRHYKVCYLLASEANAKSLKLCSTTELMDEPEE